ncbi:hypothetical protein OPT61_g1951 [Boeremia exigua]|uniref:Uncharacterized protein n=1 Tax=Boeremia exigua TaxID=749465 RepID=A0ACC2INH8_9PLEO|nr:hypothetical protein OPT61_g1951 [Boeremia exigua]
MRCEACRRLSAGMLHVQGVKNSTPWEVMCWTLDCLVRPEDNPAAQLKRLADWKKFRNVWLQDETNPYAPRCACGEADRGLCRPEVEERPKIWSSPTRVSADMQSSRKDGVTLLPRCWLQCASSVLAGLAPVGDGGQAWCGFQPERLMTTFKSSDSEYLKHSIWWGPKVLYAVVRKVGAKEGTKVAIEAEK